MRLAWQMLGQRTARRPLTVEALHCDLRPHRRQLRYRGGFGGVRLQLGELKLELLEDRAALRRLAELLVTQLGDRVSSAARSAARATSLRFPPPSAPHVPRAASPAASEHPREANQRRPSCRKRIQIIFSCNPFSQRRFHNAAFSRPLVDATCVAASASRCLPANIPVAPA